MKLNNVTLVTIYGEQKLQEPTNKAIEHCLSQVDFEDILVLSNETNNKFPTTKIHKLDKALYSQFCVEELYKYIKTDYCLMIQWDGFIIDSSHWQESFLAYDYIGAPWPYHNNCVGNGGFCIRSKKFLEISSKLTYSSNIQFQGGIPGGMFATPEDWFLCIYNYEYMLYHGVRFAPATLAYDFSVEHGSSPKYASPIIKTFDPSKIETYKSFGFHGSFNTAAMKELEK